MSDRRLQVFHAVARLKSFTRAGREIHMTQPGVTFQVRQLEEHFNTRLIDRKHSEIGLTDAGRIVFDYADRILSLYAEMESSVRELTRDMSGLLVLGASTTIAEYDLPGVLASFKRRFPEVVVRLLVSNTDGVIHMLSENQIDLGIVEAPISGKGLTVEHYHQDELVVVVPPDHPFAALDRVTPEALVGHPFVSREEGSGTRDVIAEYLRGVGLGFDALDVDMEFGSPEAIKGAVAAGLGISIISRATLRKELDAGTLVAVPLAPPIERPFSFVYQKQKFRVPAVERLISFASDPDGD